VKQNIKVSQRHTVYNFTHIRELPNSHHVDFHMHTVNIIKRNVILYVTNIAILLSSTVKSIELIGVFITSLMIINYLFFIFYFLFFIKLRH